MKNTKIQPYLFFGGRCDEALAFYGKALGAEVDMLMRYKESPEPTPPGMLAPGFEDKVMHATFQIGGTRLMASDGCGEGPSFAGFSLSLAVPTEADADTAPLPRWPTVARCGCRSPRRFGRRALVCLPIASASVG